MKTRVQLVRRKSAVFCQPKTFNPPQQKQSSEQPRQPFHWKRSRSIAQRMAPERLLLPNLSAGNQRRRKNSKKQNIWLKWFLVWICRKGSILGSRWTTWSWAALMRAATATRSKERLKRFQSELLPSRTSCNYHRVSSCYYHHVSSSSCSYHHVSSSSCIIILTISKNVQLFVFRVGNFQ